MTCNEALSALNTAGFICNVNGRGIFARYFGKGPLLSFEPNSAGLYHRAEIEYACGSK